MSETAARALCILGMLFCGAVLVLELLWCGVKVGGDHRAFCERPIGQAPPY